MTSTLHFTTEAIEVDGSRHVQLAALRPTRFVIAGWTGRDVAAIEHHILELEALGVPRPSSVPLYYGAASSLLTQVSAIESLGDRSSGEAEPMLFRHGGEWWLTVASDHTDREVETYSVAVIEISPSFLGLHFPKFARVTGSPSRVLRTAGQQQDEGRCKHGGSA